MLDYGKLWISQFDLKQRKENIYAGKKEAESYNSSVSIWADGEKRAGLFEFEADSTVLDIGCGPGILSIPLASRVKSITALDPSENMLDILKKHIKEKGIYNIKTVESCWENAAPELIGKHDYVIASYSLMMRDIVPALKKMNDTANKKVILFWFAGVPTWEQLLADLYPIVHGKGYFPGPKTDLIYGALTTMGISAKVEPLLDTSFSHHFSSRDEVIENMRRRLNVQTDEFDTLFETSMHRYFKESGDGFYFDDKTHYVKISWKSKTLV